MMALSQIMLVCYDNGRRKKGEVIGHQSPPKFHSPPSSLPLVSLPKIEKF
jgi:hypothetical protein